MFKSGLLEYEGQKYRVFVVDEKNIYRMDICEEDARFQVDSQKILYSEYRRRKSYHYGDKKYKEYINDIKSKLSQAKMETEYSSEWKELETKDSKTIDGELAFFMYTRRKRDDTFYMENVEVDGELFKETYVDQDNLFYLTTIYKTTPIDAVPLNAALYTDVASEMLFNRATRSVDASPYVPLYELEKRFDLRHLREADYKCIHSEAEGDAYLERCIQASKEGVLVGYDIETTGLEMDLYGEDELVGVILSAYPGESRYFPFRHNKFANLPMEYLDKLYDILISIQTLVVAHNGKFDRKGATRRGKDLRVGHDSYILSVLVNPVLEKGAHGLKQLVEAITGKKYLEFEDIFIDKSNINFADLPEDLVVAYACPDADNTRTVWIDQWKKLPKAERGIYRIECELASLKSDQEYWGFRVDYKDLVEGQKKCKETLTMLEDAIHQITKKSDLNISSPDSLSYLLYNEMRCPVLLRTKNDKPSTSSKALEKLSTLKLDKPKNVETYDIKDAFGAVIIKANQLREARYPLCLLLVEYRKYLKLDTAFYGRISRGSVDNGEVKGCPRYFSWINQIVSSGRQSSPLHQLPPVIKKDILSDTPEHYSVDSDFSQIELRLVFSLAEEISLILKASNPNIDIHRAIQNIISHTPIWAISKEQRKKGKSRNFGVVYGISGVGLANNQFGAGASKDQIEESTKSIHEFYQAFKRVDRYIRKNRANIEKYGYVHTMFYRFKYFYEIFNKEISQQRKNSLLRQGNNMPVQGTAADIMKMAENNIQEYIRNKGWDKLVDTSVGKYPLVRCMLSIHDEPLVSAHRSIPVEEILKMIRECMEIPIGNIFKRKKIRLSPMSKDCEVVGLHEQETDMEEYHRVVAMNKVHDNKQPFAPLFAASSISDTWEEGHSGNYELQRELCTRLLNDYERTHKSAFDPWAKKVIDVKDDNGNVIGTEQVYSLKYQIKDAINSFLDESINGYMEGLISKYGEEPKIVAEHVRDDVLTHDLIERYSPSKDEVKEHGKYSHMELISYATAKYISLRNSDSKTEDLHEIAVDKDNDVKEAMSQFINLGEELVEVAPDGTYIYDGSESVEDMEVDDYEVYEEVPKYKKHQRHYCFLLFETLLIDVDTFPNKDLINELLKYLWTLKDDKGFYEVHLKYAGQQLNTKIRLETVSIDTIEDKIREILGVSKEEDVC